MKISKEDIYEIIDKVQKNINFVQNIFFIVDIYKWKNDMFNILSKYFIKKASNLVLHHYEYESILDISKELIMSSEENKIIIGEYIAKMFLVYMYQFKNINTSCEELFIEETIKKTISNINIIEYNYDDYDDDYEDDEEEFIVY
jgi:hypothetical protein